MSGQNVEHPLGPAFVQAMNALHQLMAENPDPAVVQTCATCLHALAKLQSSSFADHSRQSGAIGQVLAQMRGPA